MSTKEKIKKEIDTMPEAEINRIYRYLEYFRKNRKRKTIVKNDEDGEWQKFAMAEFLKGYTKEDAIYDKL